MRLLCFIADRFAWKPHSQTIDDADEGCEGEVRDCVVAFVHCESADEGEARSSAFKKALKHLKWLANKRDLEAFVLHSFTHLGGDNSEPTFAREVLQELDERLGKTGYRVARTPFGWFCSWEIAVRGESLAKVWKQI